MSGRRRRRVDIHLGSVCHMPSGRRGRVLFGRMDPGLWTDRQTDDPNEERERKD